MGPKNHENRIKFFNNLLAVFNKKFSHIKYGEGFTIIELSIVVAILSILSSITITNVNKWVKLARINEAKTILDNSIVECLQDVRNTGDLPPNINLSSNVINDAKLNTIGYKLKTPDNINCGDLSIVPYSDSEKTLFEMGFQITNNNVNKIAYPAQDQSSYGSCQSWAGNNCGVSDEQLAIWAAEQALAESRDTCLNGYTDWLSASPAPTGTFQTWNSSTDTCDLPVFAFEGNLVSDQAAIDAALAAQRNANCNTKINEYKNQQNPSFSGAVPITECDGQTYYFCLGVEQQSEATMNVCLADNQVAQCNAARVAALGAPGIGNHEGPFQSSEFGPIECTQITYMCKGAEYNTEQEFNDDTNCNSVSAYPCNTGCCSAYGSYAALCLSRCGPDGNSPSSGLCNAFNTCSCYEP